MAPLLGKISILRLDADRYESAKTELEILCPRSSAGGVPAPDDDGLLVGGEKSADKCFQENGKRPLFLNMIKPTPPQL